MLGLLVAEDAPVKCQDGDLRGCQHEHVDAAHAVADLETGREILRLLHGDVPTSAVEGEEAVEDGQD